MPILYRGPCAQITQEVFEVRSPACESFPIRELTLIHIVQHRSDPLRIGSTLAKIGSTALAAIAVTVAVIAWRTLESAEVVVVALLVTTVSSVISVGCWRTPDEPYELRATFRGRSVCLLRTTDERILGQVSRALLRALETR